jgi:hypothetical protein
LGRNFSNAHAKVFSYNNDLFELHFRLVNKMMK